MRRIQRALDKESVVKAFTDGEHPCFGEIFRLLIFASMLGQKLRRREPIEKVDAGKSIPDAYFTNSPVWPGLLYLLGLAEASETSLLQRTPQAEDELATIFEEYANGGLAYLKERFENKEVDAAALVELILELTTDAPPEPDLADIGI